MHEFRIFPGSVFQVLANQTGKDTQKLLSGQSHWLQKNTKKGIYSIKLPNLHIEIYSTTEVTGNDMSTQDEVNPSLICVNFTQKVNTEILSGMKY